MMGQDCLAAHCAQRYLRTSEHSENKENDRSNVASKKTGFKRQTHRQSVMALLQNYVYFLLKRDLEIGA